MTAGRGWIGGCSVQLPHSTIPMYVPTSVARPTVPADNAKEDEVVRRSRSHRDCKTFGPVSHSVVTCCHGDRRSSREGRQPPPTTPPRSGQTIAKAIGDLY